MSFVKKSAASCPPHILISLPSYVYFFQYICNLEKEIESILRFLPRKAAFQGQFSIHANFVKKCLLTMMETLQEL
jgi:hypothetical protein